MLFWYSSLNELRQPSVYGLALCRGMPSSIILARFWGLSSLLWGYIFSRLWEPLDEGERGKWKSWFKTQHLKMKFMASCPFTLWQIDGETMETVTEFIFLGSKIIADGDCRHKIKRHLLLGRKAMTHLNSMLKSGDITLPNGPYSQSYGFSSSHVWMWGFGP